MEKPKYTLSKYDHETELAAPRDPRWNEVRDNYLKAHNKCVVCGRSTDLQIHHMFPVSYVRALGRPELELDDRNFMTLCETESGSDAQNHHLLIGHLDDWKSMNQNVMADAKKYVNKKAQDIKQDQHWKQEKAGKPKPASELTASERAHILSLIEAKFGRKN